MGRAYCWLLLYNSDMQEVEHELEEGMVLTIQYTQADWAEGCDYGDTTAYQDCSEIEVESYLLNGAPRSYKELVEQFGSERVAGCIDEALRL